MKNLVIIIVKDLINIAHIFSALFETVELPVNIFGWKFVVRNPLATMNKGLTAEFFHSVESDPGLPEDHKKNFILLQDGWQWYYLVITFFNFFLVIVGDS